MVISKLKEDELTTFRMLGDWRDSAANRYWNRFNIFLVINSSLWAIMYMSKVQILDVPFMGKKYPIGRLILSTVGIVLSYIWGKVLKAAKYYEQCWYDSMNNLINKSDTLKEVVELYDNPEIKAKKSPTKYKSTQYASFVTYVFLVLWIILLFSLMIQIAYNIIDTCFPDLVEEVTGIFS
jgi:hypothetical protein